MIYFEVRKENGDMVASNMQECPFTILIGDNKNITLRDKGIKSVFSNVDGVNIWMVVDKDEKDLLSSNRLFNKTIKTHAVLSKELLNYYFGKIRVHSHTLRSIQGKMKQKIEGLVSKKVSYETAVGFGIFGKMSNMERVYLQSKGLASGSGMSTKETLSEIIEKAKATEAAHQETKDKLGNLSVVVLTHEQNIEILKSDIAELEEKNKTLSAAGAMTPEQLKERMSVMLDKVIANIDSE